MMQRLLDMVYSFIESKPFSIYRIENLLINFRNTGIKMVKSSFVAGKIILIFDNRKYT